MFENIGGKIKTLAQIICWLGIVFSVLVGICIIILGSLTSDTAIGSVFSGMSAFTSILYFLLGPLLSWVSSLFIYGFGELIEKVTEIAENNQI